MQQPQKIGADLEPLWVGSTSVSLTILWCLPIRFSSYPGRIVRWEVTCRATCRSVSAGVPFKGTRGGLLKHFKFNLKTYLLKKNSWSIKSFVPLTTQFFIHSFPLLFADAYVCCMNGSVYEVFRVHCIAFASSRRKALCKFFPDNRFCFFNKQKN